MNVGGTPSMDVERLFWGLVGNRDSNAWVKAQRGALTLPSCSTRPACRVGWGGVPDQNAAAPDKSRLGCAPDDQRNKTKWGTPLGGSHTLSRLLAIVNRAEGFWKFPKIFGNHFGRLRLSILSRSQQKSLMICPSVIKKNLIRKVVWGKSKTSESDNHDRRKITRLKIQQRSVQNKCVNVRKPSE